MGRSPLAAIAYAMPLRCVMLSVLFVSEVPTPHENGIAELNDFRNHLVENNVLTRWQCERLLEGRYKGFFMDAFKLLRHIGHEGSCSTYAAENVQTKHRVVLRSTSIPHEA